jgi:integrase
VSKKRGNGEGSITKRKDGRWMARYTVHTAKGPKRRHLYGRTRQEVAAKLAQATSDQDSTLVFDAGNLTLGEYLDRWLKDSVKDTVRISTYERHEAIIRIHLKPAFGKLKLKAVTPAHIQGLYRDRLDCGLSPATVQKIHAVLHKALEQAMRWRLVPNNVADAARAPRPAPKRISPLSSGETRNLLEAARGNRLEALYVLAVHTGMRQGELLALNWEDVDLNEGVVRVSRTLTRDGGRLAIGEPKTKRSRRTIHLAQIAMRKLKGHLERQQEEMESLGGLYRDQGLVFTTQVGTLINPTNLRKRSLRSLLELAGLRRVRFHDLRHTCATLLLSKNVHPKYVQELLGHSSVSITLDTYSHFVPSMGKHTAQTMEDMLS